MKESLIQLDDLIIDSIRQNVSRDGKSLKLTKLSYQLLLHLIDNARKTNSVDDIAAHVWQDKEVSNETVIQRIKLLRASLGDDSKTQRYIKSVRGFGYQLVSVPILFDSVVSGPSGTKKTSRWFSFSVITIFAVLTTSLFWYWFTNSESNIRNISEKLDDSSVINAQKYSNAYSSLLERGRYYYSIGQEDDLIRAKKLFRKILGKSEHDIAAKIGLTNTLSALVCRFSHPTELAYDAEKIVLPLLENTDISELTQSDIWAARGYAVDCQGNLRLALQSYLRSVELNPNALSSISSAAHLMEKNGQIVKAIEWNLRVLKAGGLNPLTQLQLARCLELAGLSNKAEQIYHYLFEHYPDNVFINESYPSFLFNTGRLVDAEVFIHQAIDRGVRRKDLYRILGEIEWIKNGRSKAIYWYRLSSEMNKNASFNQTLAGVYHSRILKEQAREIITKINIDIEQGDTWPENFLELFLLHYFVLDDQQASLSSLERLLDNGFSDQNYLRQSALFEGIRKTTAFLTLMEKLNQRKKLMMTQLIQAKWLPTDLLNDSIPWDGRLE